MRAVVMDRYGGSEVLEVREIPDPDVGPGSVRVRVHAASVNPFDWKLRAGYLQDFMSPPLPLVLGMDAAGVVDAVGSDVTEFSVGDEVVGYLVVDGLPHGAYAELVEAPASAFVRKPESVDFLQAGSLPQAGLTAAQALGPDGLALAAGETLLVHAAVGGVGSIAVQLGRLMGARVLGTASAPHAEYLRSLGAEPVDYTDGLVDNVRQLPLEGVDAVLDLVGGPELQQSVDLVRDPSRIASLVDPGVMALGGRFLMTHPDRDQLEHLVQLRAQGELHTEIQTVFPLEKVAEAHDLVAGGHVRGKVKLDLTA